MEEGKLQWAGGRKEEATYDAGEAEDMAIQRANAPPEVPASVGQIHRISNDKPTQSHRCWQLFLTNMTRVTYLAACDRPWQDLEQRSS